MPLGPLFSWLLFPFFLAPTLPFLTASSSSIHILPITSTSGSSVWQQVQTTGTSSSSMIVTSISGTSGSAASSTTVELNAPYGVESVVITNNGTTYATTTPLTQADVEQMEEQQTQLRQHIEQQVSQMEARQQQMLQNILNRVP